MLAYYVAEKIFNGVFQDILAKLQSNWKTYLL